MTSAAASSRAGTTVWLLARLAIRIFYRVQRVGAALPDGPVLLVANHPNSLLDPALVQATAGRRIRFLAKSTLFQGHLLSPLIRRSGAIPVYRRIDPGTDVSRNEEMFAAVEAVLAQAAVVCLFPEGISHSTGRLEQLRSGAARIALSSSANGVRVAIVPIGLNFDRLAVFRSRVTVAFGQPFGCDDLVSAYQDNPQAAVRTLTMRIGEYLRRLMIEADPRGDLRMVDRIYQLYSAARVLACVNVTSTTGSRIAPRCDSPSGRACSPHSLGRSLFSACYCLQYRTGSPVWWVARFALWSPEPRGSSSEAF